MSSKRGRKRNDNLPPNRARDVQRAFRARRAAHLKALEDRVSELEEENGCLRQALNLPPSNRPPLGKGPTGKDRPKTLDSATHSFDISSSRESSHIPVTAASPISRSGSESPSPNDVPLSSLSSRPMTVIETGTWSDSVLLSDPTSHQNKSQPSHISPPPQQQQQQQHAPAQPPLQTASSSQSQHQQISQHHPSHQTSVSSQQTHQGMHHAPINTQAELPYHLAPVSTPLSAPLPMKPLQFASYSNNFASTSRPLSSTLYSSSSPNYSHTSDRPMSANYNSQPAYARNDQLRQDVTNRQQQYSYHSSFQQHGGNNLHSQTPSPGVTNLHDQQSSQTSNPRDSPLPYPHRRSLTDPQGFSIGQGFPHLPNPTQLPHHQRPPEYFRHSENFTPNITSRSGIYSPDGRLNMS